MKKLKIYLADLVYDTIKTNYTVPLNIGYIGSYCKHFYGKSIHLELFKYPAELLEKIKSDPPDILGVSNYSWNTNLSTYMCTVAKKYAPKSVTVMGGPNIRTEKEWIEKFLQKNPQVDYYAIHEGENGFSSVVGKLLGGAEPERVAYLNDGKLVHNAGDYKKEDVLGVSSPYLTGLLDKFLADPNTVPHRLTGQIPG